MNAGNKTSRLNEIAERAVSDDLNLWPTIQAHLIQGATPAAKTLGINMPPRAWRRRPILGLATAAVLALAVGATSPVWNHPQTASAEAILARAQATANGTAVPVTTYHLRLTRQVPAKGNATISSEVWYGGLDRQRSDDQIKDASGAVVSTWSVIFNGAQTWLVSTDNGHTNVVHTTGTTWNRPLDDPSKQTSLADVLARYGDAKGCLTALQQGEATVANHTAYVIAITPKPVDCGGRADPQAMAKGSVAGQRNGAAPGAADNSVGQMTVWVDEQSFLPLKTDVRNPAGVVIAHSEVTSVEYNVAVPDATFSYTAPVGATVHEFSGGSGADVKRQLGPTGFGNSAPPKTR